MNRLDTYVEAIIAATIEYDASGDHAHVVASLHPYAIRRIEEARRARKVG